MTSEFADCVQKLPYLLHTLLINLCIHPEETSAIIPVTIFTEFANFDNNEVTS